MASFSSEEARVSIQKTGVYYLRDSAAGDSVTEFNNKGLPLKTVYGLEFCAQNALDNQGVRDVIESILERPRWGLFKVFGDKLPSDDAFFLHNRTDAQTPTLLVLLLCPGSKIIFYEGSHLQYLDAKVSAQWGLLSLSRAQMRRDGITETEVTMPEGGLAIIDSRTGFTNLKGYAINIGFATEAEIQYWAKMELPDSEILRAKVTELGSRGIRSNFKFVKEVCGKESGN